jgi:predicted methyltransferase
LLDEDKSISRNHATITIKVDLATKNKIFLIKDHSQFGTFVDGDRLEKDVLQKVYADSTIVFGAGPTVLKLKYAKMMFCLSGFPPQDKIVIMEKIRDLGPFCFLFTPK